MAENLEEIEVQLRQESAKLFQYIDQRDKLVGILKYAPVNQIEKIHEAIAKLDNVIENTEDIVEIIEKKRIKTLESVENDNKLEQMMESIMPDLLRSLNEYNPEKIDE